MGSMWASVAGGVTAYLLGAVPFGYLIARARGMDIRQHGSGNIGATNVLRVVGKSWGILTFACDFAKGLIPALVFPWLARRWGATLATEVLAVTYGCLAVLGHNFPVYLRFKGGKGIATSAGALIGIAPAAVGIAAATWLLVFLLSRFVSVASIAAAAAVAGASWWLYSPRATGDSWLLPVALSALALLAIARHKSNIARLLRGTERRFEFRRGRK